MNNFYAPHSITPRMVSIYLPDEVWLLIVGYSIASAERNRDPRVRLLLCHRLSSVNRQLRRIARAFTHEEIGYFEEESFGQKEWELRALTTKRQATIIIGDPVLRETVRSVRFFYDDDNSWEHQLELEMLAMVIRVMGVPALRHVRKWTPRLYRSAYFHNLLKACQETGLPRWLGPFQDFIRPLDFRKEYKLDIRLAVGELDAFLAVLLCYTPRLESISFRGFRLPARSWVYPAMIPSDNNKPPIHLLPLVRAGRGEIGSRMHRFEHLRSLELVIGSLLWGDLSAIFRLPSLKRMHTWVPFLFTGDRNFQPASWACETGTSTIEDLIISHGANSDGVDVAYVKAAIASCKALTSFTFHGHPLVDRGSCVCALGFMSRITGALYQHRSTLQTLELHMDDQYTCPHDLLRYTNLYLSHFFALRHLHCPLVGGYVWAVRLLGGRGLASDLPRNLTSLTLDVHEDLKGSLAQGVVRFFVKHSGCGVCSSCTRRSLKLLRRVKIRIFGGGVEETKCAVRLYGLAGCIEWVVEKVGEKEEVVRLDIAEEAEMFGEDGASQGDEESE